MLSIEPFVVPARILTALTVLPSVVVLVSGAPVTAPLALRPLMQPVAISTQNNDICARDNSRNGEIAHYARNKKKKRENFKIFSESETNAVNGDLYRVRVGGSRG